MIPLFIKLIAFSINPTSVDKAGDVIVEAATPWWVKPVEILSNWGLFGAIIIIILFILLKQNLDLM